MQQQGCGKIVNLSALAGRNNAEDVPMGRLGTAEDVTNAVYFLSSQLSDYITGCTIDVKWRNVHDLILL